MGTNFNLNGNSLLNKKFPLLTNKNSTSQINESIHNLNKKHIKKSTHDILFESTKKEQFLEPSNKSLDNNEKWETDENDLILDFLQQVKVIDELNQKREFKELLNHQNTLNENYEQKSTFKSKDSYDEKIVDMEMDKFDQNFYFHNEKFNIIDLYTNNDANSFCFVQPQKLKNIKFYKNKYKNKMITLCKSLHFFNMKNKRLPCKHCGKMFTANGMGGHVSRNHKKLSLSYNRREKTKQFRKITKERNKKLSQLSNKIEA